MRHDPVLLMDMLLSAQNILEFTLNLTEDEFMASRLVQSAVLREIQIIGDAARQITPESQIQYSQVEWRKIAGMRNRIIHEYFNVRLDVMWDTVQNEIPQLVKMLYEILPTSADDGNIGDNSIAPDDLS